MECPEKSFTTELISLEDSSDSAKAGSSKDGFLIKDHIYTFKVPKVIYSQLKNLFYFL